MVAHQTPLRKQYSYTNFCVFALPFMELSRTKIKKLIYSKPIMKSFLLFLFLFLNFNTLLVAQIGPKRGPEKPPINLAELKTKLMFIMRDQQKPGLLLSIVQGDSVLYDTGLGFYNNEKYQRVDSHKLFRMGSITKTFNSLAILKLVADGKLKLSDELKKIAPEIPFNNPWEATHPVRVINLLEHTAGFDDMHFNAIYNTSNQDPKGLEAVKVFSKSLTSRWQPGQRMAYSNPGFVITGYLIEKFSGKAWDSYIKEQILLPLGMTHTNFNLRIDDQKNYAHGYKREGNGYVKIPFYPIYSGADGSLNSCGEDMAKFIQFFLNDWKIDGKPWLPKSVLDDMETSHSTLAAQKGMKNGYGLANYVSGHGAKVIFHGHDGGIDGFTSSFMYNRDEKIGFAISNNSGTNNDKIKEVLMNYLTAHLPKPKPISLKIDSKSIEPYLGHYQFMSPRNEILGFVERLFNGQSYEIAGNNLMEIQTFGNADTLVQVDKKLFRKKNYNLATRLFTENEDGEKVLMKEGDYYQKVNVVWLRFQQIMLILSVLAVLIALFSGIIWLIMALAKNLSWSKLNLRIVPFLASFCLVSAVFPFTHLVENLTEGNTINGYAIVLFLGTLGFGILAFLNIFVLTKTWKNLNNKWLKAYLLTTCVLLTYLATLFLVNNWIGIRFWAM